MHEINPKSYHLVGNMGAHEKHIRKLWLIIHILLFLWKGWKDYVCKYVGAVFFFFRRGILSDECKIQF